MVIVAPEAEAFINQSSMGSMKINSAHHSEIKPIHSVPIVVVVAALCRPIHNPSMITAAGSQMQCCVKGL